MILGHSRIVRDLDRGRNMGCKDFPDTIGLVQQCMGLTFGRSLLDKPAVAPFFNRPMASLGQCVAPASDKRAYRYN
jgi:hypothetical protein